MWGDGALYPAGQLDAALAALTLLLQQQRARGTLLLDEQHRARYFGVTVFLQERAADQLVGQPQPRLGARVLAGRQDSPGPILDVPAIARGNAQGGLHMVVINQGWDMPAEDAGAWPMLMGAVLHDFQEVHRGFRLARVVGEAFGEDGVEIVTKSRAYANTREFTSRGPTGAAARSVVFWSTRAEAAQQWSPLLPMFTYNPPRIFFTGQEQDLLREALACGATDPVLAARLHLTVPAVKARWKRLFERVADRMPELLPARDQRATAARGAQLRHVVLQFARRHPSELTPYYVAHARRGAALVRAPHRQASDRG